jgi:hypothetical protein
MKLLGIISVDFNILDQLLIRYSAFIKCLGGKLEYSGQYIKLCIDFKKAYDSARREVLYNMLIESGIPMKVGRLVKM